MNKVWISILVVCIVFGSVSGLLYTTIQNKDKEHKTAMQGLDEKISQETALRETGDQALGSAINETNKNLETRSADLDKKIDSTKQALQQEIDNLNNTLSNELNQLENTLNNYKASTDANIADIKSDMQKNRDELQAVINETRTSLTTLVENTKTELKGDISSLGQKLLKLQKDIVSLQTSIKNLGNRADLINQSLGLLKEFTNSETSKIKNDISSMKSYEQQLNQKITVLTDRTSTLENRAGTIEESMQTLRNSTESSLAVIQEQLQNQSQQIEDIWSNLTAVWNELSKEAGYWESYAELAAWVQNDTTDQNTYIPVVYDCDDFAIDLARNALKVDRLVYPIPMLTELYYNPYGYYPQFWFVLKTDVRLLYFSDGSAEAMAGNHMADLTYCKDVGWVVIEPQTDAIAILNTHEL